MSIFVNKETTFPLNLKYRTFTNDEGQIVGVKVLDDSVEDASVLHCRVRGCDYNTMSQIMEQATVINHYSGKPVVRSVVFFRLMLLNFFVAWDAKDEDGTTMPINDETVSMVHDRIARALVSKYLNLVGGR